MVRWCRCSLTVTSPLCLQEKRHWRRYIYLWIYYAVFEELTTKDMERARQVYQMCLRLIPHKVFTFAEIWLLYSKFEIRQKDLSAARKALVTLHLSYVIICGYFCHIMKTSSLMYAWH